MIRFKPLLSVLIFSLLFTVLSGCSSLAANNTEENSTEEKKSEVDPYADARPANPTYEEVPFEVRDLYSPPRQPFGGIWIYTKEKHPGYLDNDFNWDENDVLLVQVMEKKYYGYDAEIVALQRVRPDVIKIVLKLYQEDGNDPTLAARCYAMIPRGAIPPDTKFVVESETGERLNQGS